MADAPRVFLSYSHDSDEHADRVLALADALCDRGIEVILDRYVHPVPAEGWPRWMERNLDEAQFVLMVCTETYRRRAMGLEEAGKGLGVDWEGNLINNLIYHRINEDKPSGLRFLPILLPGFKPDHIPIPVRGHTHYQIAAFDFTDPGFEALYRHLTDQPATPRPDLGPIQNLPPKPRPQAVPGPLPPSGGPMTNIGGRIVGSAVGAGNTVNARDINTSLSHMTGPLRLESLHVGDETKANIGGDATNVAIGQRAHAKAGDINVFKQGVDQSLGLDPDLKQRFKEARETIEASGVPQKDKDDAAARLGDLQGELEQPNPDKGRIRRCLEWLKDIVPSAAEILSSAAKIGELFRG